MGVTAVRSLAVSHAAPVGTARPRSHRVRFTETVVISDVAFYAGQAIPARTRNGHEYVLRKPSYHVALRVRIAFNYFHMVK